MPCKHCEPDINSKLEYNKMDLSDKACVSGSFPPMRWLFSSSSHSPKEKGRAE
jgi:hypothetical protein